MTSYTVIGPKNKNLNPNFVIVDTTSKGPYYNDLSPFHLGPIENIAKNMENFWQFSKRYKDQSDEEWLEWRNKGFNLNKAIRYPKGKNAKPLYSVDYFTEEKLSYIEARKRIYIPWYSKLVQITPIFKRLQKTTKDIYLWDFDGYNHKELSMSLRDVINCETRKMGHAFVLYGLLTGELKEALIEKDQQELIFRK